MRVNGYYIKPGTHLVGANLRGVYLVGADLHGADLRWACLAGANLREADLRGAHLRRACLGGADLEGADLRGATLSWQSHDIIAELLRRSAGQDASKRKLAGLVLVSRDWCWDKFLSLRSRDRKWALDVLAKYVKYGDGAPELLRRRAKQQ